MSRRARLVGMLAAVAFGVTCWTFRTRHLNPDGAAFQAKFEESLARGEVFTTHDEILEFVVHFKAWTWARARWGWDVARTYQPISCAAGTVFVLVVLSYARIVEPSRAGLLALVICAGGYVRLFFGDVENYTLTAVFVMAYFLASERYLQGRTSIVSPSFWLAAAMMFHLVAGFLGLSLLYLWRREWRRSSGRALGGVAAFAIVILATLGAAQRWWNLPLAAFTTSHAAGNGGHYDQVLARPTLSHFATQLRLLTWLCPAWVVLVVLAVRGRLPRTPRTRHLAAASAGMLLFFFSWFPALGADDWNLFANAAIPLSLLTWTGIFTCLPRLPYHSPSC